MSWRAFAAWLARLGAALACLGAAPAFASSAEDEVRARLLAFAAAIDARDAAAACDLFAEDLRYDTRLTVNGDRQSMCAGLDRALADPSYRVSHRPEVLDVLASGDMVVVRVIWMLTVDKDGRAAQSAERGLDVFQRGADGVWRIVRFMALLPAGDG